MECVVEANESENTIFIKRKGYQSSQNTWEPLGSVPLFIFNKHWFSTLSVTKKSLGFFLNPVRLNQCLCTAAHLVHQRVPWM